MLAVANNSSVKQDNFDIVEVARRCGIHVLKRLPDEQWLARCPFCGDSQKSQKHGHLYLKPSTGEYKCQRCGVGGYTVGLYARLRGVDTKLAYAELVHYTMSGFPEVRYDSSKIIQAVPEEPVAPVEHRNKVYTSLIKILPLLPAHRADLLRRGLSEALIERNGYRSLPVVPKNRLIVCGKLLSQEHDLTGVPGFYINEAGEWDMMSVSGYLIPVRDPGGMVQGMQIRLENPKDGKKYIWFSSRGRPGGCGARVWVHVAEPLGVSYEKRVWVSEGPLKADIGAHYLGVRFLGVPGAAAWSNVIETARAIGVREIVLAYDADQRENPEVKKAAVELAEELRLNRIDVLPAVWAPEMGKGIDDACLVLTKERKAITEAYFLKGVRITRTVTETVRVEGHSSLIEKASEWLKRIIR